MLRGSAAGHHPLHHAEGRARSPRKEDAVLCEASRTRKTSALGQKFSVGGVGVILPPGDVCQCLETV